MSVREQAFRMSRRLHFGDIALIPVDDSEPPYKHERYGNAWHVPGRTISSTEQLVKLADSRGITVRLTESSLDGSTTIRLN